MKYPSLRIATASSSPNRTGANFLPDGVASRAHHAARSILPLFTSPDALANSPAHLVFEAWTKPELFQRWWVPKSYGLTLLSCEMDVRVGGQYRLVFQHGDSTMAFFGTYREVTPPSRLVWTNEEGEDGETVTTVTFEEKDGKTSLVVHDLYPSKAALDAAIASGSTGGMPDQLDQLDEFLASFGNGSESA